MMAIFDFGTFYYMLSSGTVPLQFHFRTFCLALPVCLCLTFTYIKHYYIMSPVASYSPNTYSMELILGPISLFPSNL